MDTRRRPRGEYAKTVERRRQILDAAVAVFSESGFRKGSLREVADRVSLSQAGLLHHYASKSDLLEAVLAWRDARSAQEMGEPRPEGLEFLRAMADVADTNEETPGLIHLHVVVSAEATSAEHPVHDYFVRRYDSVIEATREAFEHAAARGLLQPHVDCSSAARTLVALMDGLQVQWLLNPDSVDMGADLRRYLRPLLTVDL
jgi:AcrR family transcriptional regulator